MTTTTNTAIDYLIAHASKADTADALHRADWSEMRIALDEAGEAHLWAGLREAVLAIDADADI